jgi:hypothetical protein
VPSILSESGRKSTLSSLPYYLSVFIGLSGSSKGKRRSPKTPRKTKKTYTHGELNKLIDSAIHPFCKNDKRFILLDAFLHAMVERDPPESFRKFVRYNLPELLKQLSERKQGQS